MVLFSVLTDGIAAQAQNITNLVLQNCYILILAIGMLLVIIAGHIDLSVGSVVALVGAVSAVADDQERHAVVGRRHRRASSSASRSAPGRASGSPTSASRRFIVTLAGMLVFRGLTFLVLEQRSRCRPFPPEYQQIANGFLNGLFGGYGFDLFTLLIGVFAVAGFAWTQWRSPQRPHPLRAGGRGACRSSSSSWSRSPSSSCSSPGSSPPRAASRSC